MGHLYNDSIFFSYNFTLFFLFSIPEPTPSTMTALHLFGAEMLKLSRGLDQVSPKMERKELLIRTASVTSDDKSNDNITIER